MTRRYGMPLCVLLGIGMWLSVESLNMPLALLLLAAILALLLHLNPVDADGACPRCTSGDCTHSVVRREDQRRR